MVILIQIALGLFFLSIIIILSYSMISGGPYAPIGDQRIEEMLDLLSVKSGEKAADIGAGDGRLVRALAKKGVLAHGFEINPLLIWIARRKIWKAKLEKKAFMHLKDMWAVDYSSYDIITVYLSPHVLGKLENKLRKDLKRGGRIVLNHYAFPHWKPSKKKGNVYLYQK